MMSAESVSVALSPRGQSLNNKTSRNITKIQATIANAAEVDPPFNAPFFEMRGSIIKS